MFFLRLPWFSTLLGGLFWSSQGLAIMEGYGAMGYRMSRTSCCGPSPEEDATGTGIEIQLGGYVDPVPLIPFAVGGALFYHQTGSAQDPVSSSGWGLDVEGKIWYPLPKIPFSIFAKGGYTLVGGYDVTTKDKTDQYTPSGPTVSGGLRFDILFRGAIFIQTTYRQSELKRKKETSRDTPISTVFGVQIGI
jgi:hypothetical protein